MSRHITDDSTVVTKDAHLSETVDGERIILDMESGTYYSLDGIGDEIWRQLDEPTPVEDIYSAISEEYDIERSECRSDIISFVQQLWEANLLELSDDTEC